MIELLLIGALELSAFFNYHEDCILFDSLILSLTGSSPFFVWMCSVFAIGMSHDLISNANVKGI